MCYWFTYAFVYVYFLSLIIDTDLALEWEKMTIFTSSTTKWHKRIIHESVWEERFRWRKWHIWSLNTFVKVKFSWWRRKEKVKFFQSKKNELTGVRMKLNYNVTCQMKTSTSKSHKKKDKVWKKKNRKKNEEILIQSKVVMWTNTNVYSSKDRF